MTSDKIFKPLNKLSMYHLDMLYKWQKETYFKRERPTEEDSLFFLLNNCWYTSFNLEVLKKWNETRHRREKLTISQIKDWLQFYYT